MIGVEGWPAAPALFTERLSLEPQRVGDAREMARLLADPELYSFVGGGPLTVEELRDRYRRLALGRSEDGSQRWLNWTVRLRDCGRAVGTVQATVIAEDDRLVARLAWMIGVEHQRLGYAAEAAAAMAAWLREQGADGLIADVHPQHEASVRVARALGLARTDEAVDGEIRWTG